MSTHEQSAELLALYALGALPAAEQAELEQHLAGCATCRRELEVLRGDAALLALTTLGPAPPERSRARLVSALATEPHMRTVRRRRSFFEFVPILATAVLVLISILLWRENVQLRRRLEYSRIALEQEHQRTEQAQMLLEMLRDPEAQHVTLVSPNQPPHPHGRAIYAPKRAELVFMATNLAPLPAGKTYELWLLPKSGGKPMPAGTFKPNAAGEALVMNPPLPVGVEAASFAVTIEPDGGKDTPTMPIQMMGSGQ
ncbi:MAG: anti-sigma factor [Acidobacteriota bacterium]|nr:anti-sigma factor [Acidobacteriota bacterium]